MSFVVQSIVNALYVYNTDNNSQEWIHEILTVPLLQKQPEHKENQRKLWAKFKELWVHTAFERI